MYGQVRQEVHLLTQMLTWREGGRGAALLEAAPEDRVGKTKKGTSTQEVPFFCVLVSLALR